ncbi:hypothetical protein [Asticcacaulis machinosus]|uniref:Uncharacterized protein n=1 Tax=Asticcacaulis machinosus TaxID=2984211 RepID=A0ABT5HN58_9CAUL|nr:hypothetical protein [Asticcacaulis machinosus]MDC7677657.1 hypothetical protein [Asticcacaulis machinosus]
MSSFFDIVISFVAALIAAAFAHFGASEMPTSRATPSSVPEASAPQDAPARSAPSAAPAQPAMTPVSAPQPPEPPRFDNSAEMAAIEAEHMAAAAAHEAQMRAHEAEMRAFDAMLQATRKAVSEADIRSHLSFQSDGKTISGLTQSEQAALNAAVASHIEVMVSASIADGPEICTAPEVFRAPALTAQVNPGISLSL